VTRRARRSNRRRHPDVRAPHDRAPGGADPARLGGDLGAATSLSIALLTPVVVLLAFAAFQAAMWSHARTEARVVARDTAALVARAAVPPGDAEQAALTVLTADTDLRDVEVVARSEAGVVTVTVNADAPGVIRGTSVPVSVTVAVPVEELTP
jgi:hypothetical protein